MLEESPDAACYVALEAASDLAIGLAFAAYETYIVPAQETSHADTRITSHPAIGGIEVQGFEGRASRLHDWIAASRTPLVDR